MTSHTRISTLLEMDQLPLIIGAIVILLIGVYLYFKITAAFMKLAVLAIVIGVLIFIFRDKLPL